MSDASKGNVAVAEVAAEEHKHPLLEFVPTVFHSFEEWMRRWDATTYLAEKLGLLHHFTMENGWWMCCEAVSFVLEIADDHNREYKFSIQGERDGCNENVKNRKAITEKSFSVLCLRFFKTVKNEQPLWWWMLDNKKLFQKVLWFLRSDERGMVNRYFESADSNHHQEIFGAFLRNFAELGWQFRSRFRNYGHLSSNDSVERRLIAARPQLIEILRMLGAINWLNGRELDSASLEKLTELALNAACYLPPTDCSSNCKEYKKPISLEEAVLGGSVAAEVVLLHNIRQQEQKRIDALLEASKRQHQEEARRRELANVEERRRALAERARELKEQGKK